MQAETTFNVFGDPVEVIVAAEATNGTFSVVTQTCQPGGGPPPHRHTKEDEVFTTLEGEFELFDGTSWHPLPRGGVRYALRGSVHTFRNSGSSVGKILIVATPGGLDRYLRDISPLVMPNDLANLITISNPYGITFPSLA